MERAIESEELRKSLEQILELCLKTARRLRSVLEEGARRTSMTTDTDDFLSPIVSPNVSRSNALGDGAASNRETVVFDNP